MDATFIEEYLKAILAYFFGIVLKFIQIIASFRKMFHSFCVLIIKSFHKRSWNDQQKRFYEKYFLLKFALSFIS